ncbi:hypothetical protein HN371_16445 [Candidatus Poribacteria bacterium]|nr:hypothetical protein [Candidatus Poribacteria bacterium]MBT5533762.1 hypothetical protein [Candidatus Poribacteria bacterium]MBT5711497.1 hypothetical protein [Candidatus Poribacteria bacterium]MBT7100623.1 hypothetical protein [Candidatus Poribacteria bacterium]MBT7806946.1 hypothetical protein [Candidatus Poribacteria bacterium]
MPTFDPEAGTVVREPDGAGSGYWVGAPTVYHDPADARYYMSYRIRRPRPDRGVENRIAVSEDGVTFDDIYRLHKDDLGTESIERCSVYRTDDGQFHYAVSYVDPADRKWRTDVLTAADPSGFDTGAALPVVTAYDIGGEGVKDPNVYRIGGQYVMLLSYAPTPSQRTVGGDMHGTGDVYNTGITKSHSGLATSHDGYNWTWEGDIMSPPDKGWDQYAARLGTIVWTPPVFVGLYDGSHDVSENYEERCGLATSADLRTWRRLTVAGPWVMSPHGTGSVRYMDVLADGESWLYYYEMVRADGSHDLRVQRVAS